jgi:hypothetical protein
MLRARLARKPSSALGWPIALKPLLFNHHPLKITRRMMAMTIHFHTHEQPTRTADGGGRKSLVLMLPPGQLNLLLLEIHGFISGMLGPRSLEDTRSRLDIAHSAIQRQLAGEPVEQVNGIRTLIDFRYSVTSAFS